MADKSSLICYLRTDNLEKLPHFPESLPWNSKKWRMLMYLSEDFSTCYAGRQYPFFSKHILNTITDSFLYNVIDRGILCPSWSAWHCDHIDETVLKAENSSNNEEQYLDLDYYIPIRNRLYRLKNLIKEPKYCLHYNDLLLSSCYDPYYCWRDSWSSAKRKIYVGNEVKCVQCEMNLIGKNGNMLCDSCNEEKEYHYCDCCDCRLPSDRSYHVLYNCLGETSPVCDNCFELCGRMCENCGDYYFSSLIKEVDGKKLCPCCYDRQVSTSTEASIPLGTVFYNQTAAQRAEDIAFQNYLMREADLRDLITVETATPTLTPNGNLEIEIGANFNEVLERFLSSPLPITTDNETIVN
jgi:hypothetical protein